MDKKTKGKKESTISVFAIRLLKFTTNAKLLHLSSFIESDNVSEKYM